MNEYGQEFYAAIVRQTDSLDKLAASITPDTDHLREHSIVPLFRYLRWFPPEVTDSWVRSGCHNVASKRWIGEVHSDQLPETPASLASLMSSLQPPHWLRSCISYGVSLDEIAAWVRSGRFLGLHEHLAGLVDVVREPRSSTRVPRSLVTQFSRRKRCAGRPAPADSLRDAAVGQGVRHGVTAYWLNGRCPTEHTLQIVNESEARTEPSAVEAVSV